MKNATFIEPVASATVASTSGRIPRRRTGREAIERTSTTIVALSPTLELGDRPRLAPVARQVLEQVPDVFRPSVCAACWAFAPCQRSGLASSEGRG